jgi:hypothetical protein
LESGRPERKRPFLSRHVTLEHVAPLDILRPARSRMRVDAEKAKNQRRERGR